MAPDLSANLAVSAALARLGPVVPSSRCASAEVLARLWAGEVGEGMCEALRCLAEDRAEDRADGLLVQVLRENPFLRAALAPPHGYEGDPTVVDLALGVAPLPPDTTPLGLAMYRWMGPPTVPRSLRSAPAGTISRPGSIVPPSCTPGHRPSGCSPVTGAPRQRRLGPPFDPPGQILAGRIALADCAL
jgi:hypothetical protein